MKVDESGGSDLCYGIPDLEFNPLTEEQKRKATLYVCGSAEDADDARLLMEALGL